MTRDERRVVTRRHMTRRAGLMLFAGALLALGPSAAFAAPAVAAPLGTGVHHSGMSDGSGMCASMNAPWI